MFLSLSLMFLLSVHGENLSISKSLNQLAKSIGESANQLAKSRAPSPLKVAKAPDGNGGVYSALKYLRLLEDMTMRGVKYLDCYGVDNALVRVADPTFLGYFIDKGVVAAAKVVRKLGDEENHGDDGEERV